MAEIKFYNSVIFMSVAVAIASAINLAMLFRYIIRSVLNRLLYSCCVAARQIK